MASYTTPTEMAAYLGVTFTAEQTTVAQRVADAVTTWIDRRTGKTWQDVDGTIVDEIQPVNDGIVYVAYVPVTAVSELELRVRGGANPWELVDPSQYVLADPSTGRIELSSAPLLIGAAYDARVDYATLVTAPPDDILLAAAILASYFMTSSLRPGTAGLASLSVGQGDIAVAFASGAASSQAADLQMAVSIVESYRMPVIA